MKETLTTNLVLFGYKKTGKTYYSKLFAKLYKKNFIDTDLLVEKIYKQKFQKYLNFREIYRSLGNKGFHELEKIAIDSLKNIKNSIISVGGATVLNLDNCYTLKQFSLLVYLKTDKKILKNRILKDEIPAFLNPENPEQSFERMYEKRKKIYENISDVIIDTHKKTTTEILNELLLISQMTKTPC